MADVPGYPWLQTARDDVDVKDVSPVLLKRLNALGKAHKSVITVFSGYRDPAYNKSVGGAQDSQHTHGRAVDATINGRPVGEVISQQEFVKYKLRNGNQPNFYKGKPDPAHTDLGLAGGGAATTANPPVPVAVTPDTLTPVPTVLPDPYPQAPPIPGGVVTQGPVAPGTLPADNYNPRWLAQTWAEIAALPSASPESQQYMQLAQQAAGNAG